MFSVALMDAICPPSTVLTAFNAYGGGAGVAKEIEDYTNNSHEGGVDYQIRPAGELVCGVLRRRADDRRHSLDQ